MRLGLMLGYAAGQMQLPIELVQDCLLYTSIYKG